MSYPVTGSCQCGRVHYKILNPPVYTAACHCQDCQKLSAGAFSISMLVRREDFELLGGSLKFWDRMSASGNTTRCYFCPVCSNRIYHENPGMPEIIRLKPGTLDDTSIVQPDAHVWTKRTQAWFKLPEDIPCHESQPDISALLKEKGII